MDIHEYQKGVSRTLSDQFHTEDVQAHELLAALHQISEGVEALDRMKKSLFYGKKVDHPFIDALYATSEHDLEPQVDFPKTTNGQQFLHAIIGAVTEAGELSQIAMKQLYDPRSITAKEVIDECGDLIWFSGIALEKVNSSLDQATTFNREKLKRRFPNKFDANRANNPNKAHENDQ